MQTRTRRRPVTAVVAAIGLVAATAPAALADTYDDRVVIDQGHLDLFYVVPEGEELALVAHTDDHGDLDPSELVLHGKPSVAARTVGAGASTLPGWPSQGETYYLLPQTNEAGQLFVGFGYDPSMPSGTSVTYELQAVEGPGAFATWQWGMDGPEVFFGSDDAAPKSFTSAAQHEHLNWGFTEQGEYVITVEPTVHRSGHDDVTLPAADYTFFIGEELPSDGGGDVDTTLTIEGLRHHYHAGGVATLRAVQTPDTGIDHYHWFTRAAGESSWSVVPDALTDTYGFVVGTADDGLQVKAALYDHDHEVIAESDPVTIDVDDHGNDPINGPIISATLAEDEGALVVSVAPEHRRIEMAPFTLNEAADRYVSTGSFGGIAVTDSRSQDPGWTASGRVRSFTTVDGDVLHGRHLGWAPKVLGSSAGQEVTAGPAVAPVAPDATTSGGLAAWSVLGSSAEGAGVGVAELGADLRLEAPVTLAPGTYRAMLILTVI